jgi:DNA-binding NtrC family response regulator
MFLQQALQEMKILLVDDDQWIRNSLTYYFTKKTLAFTALESAEQALELLEQEAFDIVLCDYRLPGMDGLAFFGHIRAQRSDMIKILITAFGTEEVQAAAQNIGVHEFIQKPFTVKTIAACLERMIRSRTKGIASLAGVTDEPFSSRHTRGVSR